MPRKGSTKVRTGCLTCKIRKVKCDEGKPSCKRCTSTGRKCDGYAPPPTSSSALSWYRPRHLFPQVDHASERRSLHFFCVVAAPALSGPLDPYFWTHLVLQFGQMEPAVRHSIVAVGSLYEQIHRNPNNSHLLPPPDDNLILCHYNAAIQHLKTMKNESLVLLVCILFVCIEFLRGSREAATEHCQHGISILERVEQLFPWTKQYLSPLFRRLSIFPFFFSIGSKSPPKLLGLNDVIPSSFSTFGDAQFYLDGVLGRTVRLVRRGDAYRLGSMRHEVVSSDLIAEQDLVRAKLDEWHTRFLQFASKSSELGTTAVNQCNMLMRYQICRVWVETPFEYHETVYDEYLDMFRSMVDLATTAQSSDYCNSSITFTFEMGFMPLLYFIVMKCRCLDIRLRALSLMKNLGAARENLWEMITMFAAAKRIVEIEHGAILTDDAQLSGEPYCPGFPPDEMRIRDSTTEPYPVVQMVDGVEKTGRLGGFFMRTADDRIYVRSEFLLEPAWR
ncbi:hypothetical protein HD806DRAFT_425202 [Xylariaceae sp. AK1471]|nr:hypothetical protein HD806DRAFT_425202 [Xylariaceae sp. AK1471]